MLQYPWLFASFMPSVVAGRLGVRGVVVAASSEVMHVEKIKEFEKQPRGGLGSFVKLEPGDEWLRERNSLLKEFGKDGKGVRVLVCEGGVCREETVNGAGGLEDLESLESALPAVQAPATEAGVGL